MTKTITEIRYWTRDKQAVDEVKETSFKVDKKDVIHNGGILPKEEAKQLLSTLFDVIKIEETEEEYKSYLFEDNKENFMIKFFLVIRYSDFTYLAVKGVKPFLQKNFKEIQALFEPYLK